MYIRLKGGGLFAFAGVYAGYLDNDEKPATCAIITTSANELVQPIHNRMPVILGQEQMPLWLDPSLRDPGAVIPLLRPYPSELMEAYPVSTLVNYVRNDGPELVQPIVSADGCRLLSSTLQERAEDALH